jgi:uncharacterized membrane protein (DUF441 family)
VSSSSLIFLILILGLWSKNRLIYLSAGILMVFSYLGLLPHSSTAQNTLQEVGVILLVIGVLIPFSQGFLSPADLYNNLLTFEGAVSLGVGIASAVMAKGGIELMRLNPGTMIGLLFGSIIGTAFFGGIPTGPLVAAGLAAFLISALRFISKVLH